MNKESCEYPAFYSCSKKRTDIIGVGVDSSVYKIGEYVIKDYKVPTSSVENVALKKQNVRDYFELTGIAQKIVNEEKLSLSLPFSKKKISLVINPFLGLRDCPECGGMEGVAKYIPGKTLDMCSDMFDIKEIKGALLTFSCIMESKTGFIGINVIPMNVKIDTDKMFVITDLCADISMVRRNYSARARIR